MTLVLVSLQQDVFGGPHNQWLRIAGHLRDGGITVVPIVPSAAGDAANRFRAAGIAVESLRTYTPTLRGGVIGTLADSQLLAQSVREFKSLALDLKADAVVACGLANLPAALGARAARTPLVWQLLSVFAPSLVRWSASVAVATLADSVMVVGDRCLRAHPAVRFRRRGVYRFTPPVDTDEFVPSRSGDARIVVGTVGNFNPHKGHDILWTAAHALWVEGHDFDLKICGQDSPSYSRTYEAQLGAWIASLEPWMRDRVRYCRPRGSVARELDEMTIFALPSRSEGIPTSLLEAMAAGKACVAFDVGGISEVLTSGVDGILAGSPRPNNLTEALRLLLCSKSMRERLGAQARARAEVEFSVDRCAVTHLEAIRFAEG